MGDIVWAYLHPPAPPALFATAQLHNLGYTVGVLSKYQLYTEHIGDSMPSPLLGASART
jgi:hypothetical protein